MLKDSCFKKALFEVIDFFCLFFFSFPGVDARLNDLAVLLISTSSALQTCVYFNYWLK